MGQDGVEVEVNVSDVHMNAADAFAAGKWEASVYACRYSRTCC